jgi:hypothetical protein
MSAGSTSQRKFRQRGVAVHGLLENVIRAMCWRRVRSAVPAAERRACGGVPRSAKTLRHERKRIVRHTSAVAIRG